MLKTSEAVLQRIREASEQHPHKLDLSFDQTKRTERLTEIPPEVFELKDLETLDLSKNALTSIPDSIFKLPRLTSLNLSGNRLVTIPGFLVQLEQLEDLNL